MPSAGPALHNGSIALRIALPAALAAALVLAAAAGGSAQQVPSGTLVLNSGTGALTLVLLPASTIQQVPARASESDDLAALSPDGRRIAYTGGTGIWVMRRDGTQARRVLGDRTGLGYGQVAWSPNGLRLAFVRNGTLITSSAGGKAIRHVIGRAGTPDWMADGKHLVFVRDPDPQTQEGAIWSVGTDGRGLRRLVPGRWLAPHVSPDGTRLVFSRHTRDGVYTAPASGGGAHRVRQKGSRPVWSPDGRYMAFSRRVACSAGACSNRVFIARVGSAAGPRPYGPVLGDLGQFTWGN